ncbi:BON domain-containing protein [Actinomadura soli]|uniref:BON domain-containing protein n=1 Tax=Actinomadura soli TaxID=2508997 RepID=A0A5C4J3Q2_9ACTN|nr:BON domain-containing protein [Actinomadura soli]TMQ91110.1 BON domain-containing protein [Actinomadura soli]
MTEPPEYLSAHIQERVAAEAHELGIRVDVSGDVVRLRGEVVSEEQRREVEATARDAAGGREISNELHVVAVTEPDGEERLS